MAAIKDISCFDDSNSRFINSKLFSPVILDGGPPRFDPKWGEYYRPQWYRDWWQNQRYRCINGYTVGGVHITGPHYFYLNFWRIKAKKRAHGLIPPWFLDIDKLYFDAIEEARKTNKNIMILKRRQIGVSEKSAVLVGHEMTMFPSTQSLILAGEDKYCQATTRLTKIGLNELDRSGREFWKRKELGDTLHFTKMGFKLRKLGIEKGNFSELHCITCHNNPQATIGKTPSLVIMEESGKFDKLIDTYQYIEPSMKQGGQRDGRITIIQGTGGEMDKGVGEMMDMFYNPDAFDLLAFNNPYEDVAESNKISMFIPAWYFYVIDENGNSLKEEGEKKIAEDRARVGKMNDASKMTNEITQMPLTPEEAFTLSGAGRFNSALLGEQRTKIIGSEKIRSLPQYGNLVWVKEGKQIVGVEWKPGIRNELDSDGYKKYPFMVLEHPDTDENGKVPEALYFGGTDPYDQDETETTDSLGSCSIFKGFWNISHTSMLFAARYTDRPRTAKEFYENTAKLMYYYGAMNLLEHSNLGILNWYVDNGFEWMLKEKPMIAYSDTIDTKTVNKYGISARTKPFWESNYADYIEEFYYNMFDLEQVSRAITYRRKVNDDITISSMLAYLHYTDDMDILQETENSKENKESEGVLTGYYGTDYSGNIKYIG